MLDNYKKEYEDIKVPSKLKTETLLKMKEAEEKRPIFSFKMIFVTACTIVIAFSVIFTLTQNNNSSNFKDGKILVDVDMNEGNLKFEKQEDSSHFGNFSEEETKTINKKEAENLTNQNFKPIQIQNYTLMKKEYYAYYDKGEFTKVEWVYTYQKEEKEIVLHYFSKSDEFVTNSDIEGKKVAIYYDGNAEEVFFDAYFKLKKGMVEVLTSNLSQEEFSNSLVKIVNKLK